MRSLQILSLTAFAMLLLLGLWYGLDGGASGGVTEILAAPSEGGAGSELSGPGGAGVALEGDPDADGRRSIDIAPLAPEEGADEDLAGGPSSTVFGRVLGLNATGLPGVQVHVSQGQSWMNLPPDLEQGTGSGQRRNQLLVETDEQGRFELHDLEPNQYDLAFHADGYARLTRKGLKVPEHEVYDLGSYQLALGIVVEGLVTDRRGDPVDDAVILSAVAPDAGSMRLELPGRGIPLAHTDAAGAFRAGSLAPGSWRLLIDSPRFRLAEEKGKTEPAGTIERGLRIILEEGLSISGRVVDMAPGAEEALRVTARFARKQPAGGAEAVQGAERHRARSVDVAADGSFELQGLPSGVQYLLTLYRKQLPAPVVEPEEGALLAGGEPVPAPAQPEKEHLWERVRGVERALAMSGDQDVELKNSGESSLVLHVQDGESGDALETFVVSVRGEGLRGGGLLSDDGETRSFHPGGTARFEKLRPRSAGSLVTVFVRAPGYVDLEKKGVMVNPGDEVDVGELELEPGPNISVRVIDDASGEPVEGARVLISRAAEAQEIERYLSGGDDYLPWTNRNLRFARTDERGEARLTAFKGELCTLRAKAEGYSSCEEVSLIPPHEEHSEELRLEPSGSVLVRVVDELGDVVPGAYVMRRLDGNPVWDFYEASTRSQSSTDEKGEVLFDQLEPGLWTFYVVDESALSRGWWGVPDPRPDQKREISVDHGTHEEVELPALARGGFLARLMVAGEPCSGALAKLHKRQTDEMNRYMYYGFGGSPSDDPTRCVSDHEGRIRYERLDKGTYDLVVTHPDRRMPTQFEVEVVQEPVERVLELGFATIEGLVLTPEGEPLANLAVSVWPTQRNYHLESSDYRITIREDQDGDADWEWDSVEQDTARTDEEGRYVLPGVMPDTELQVSVGGRYVVGETRAEGPLDRHEWRSEVNFVLPRAGVLSLRVSGLSRNDRRYYPVRYVYVGEDREERPKNSHVRPRRPTARVNSMFPGRWRVELRHPDDKQGDPIATGEFEIIVNEIVTYELSVP